MTKRNGHDHGDPAQRLLALFAGNTRSSGRYDAKRDKAFTESAPAKLEDFQNHLSGAMGVGVVPIQDDDTCTWAAIDIDNHDTDEDIPPGPVNEKISQFKLPLIACRSKSGGIHCYVFFTKPQPCVRVKVLLTKWAALVGHGGSEVFPKQGKLATSSDGKKQLGNWINLPYMGGDKTMRYAVVDGKKLSLDEFLNRAEGGKVTDADLRGMVSADHPEAPPCVQKMFSNGVAQGQRNEALYAVSVYLRKQSPENFNGKALDANQQIFGKPLGRAEALRTITSAGRPDYTYRCGEEPCRSLCDRTTCLTRKFGITPADAERIDAVESLPVFSDLVKFLSEPIRWELTVDGIKIANIDTETLLDWKAIRQLAEERLLKVIPLLKPPEWDRIRMELYKGVRVVETPDDASINGLIRERLREFAAKTELTNKGEDKEDRKGLLRGLPVVQVMDGERCVVFRQSDFVNYLKRTRSEEIKGINLWLAAKDMGVTHGRMRIGSGRDGDNINVWYIPVKAVTSYEIEAPTYKAEL